MQGKTAYRVLSVIVAGILSLSAVPSYRVQAAESHTELKDDLLYATKMIENLFSRQYEDAEESVKETIKEKGYDYTMTMETFYDNENPYRDVDYIDLIATYASIKEYCGELHREMGTGISGMEFLKVEIKDMTLEEEVPILAASYEETETGGVYVKSGNIVITEETEVGEYALLDKEAGTYIKTGEKKVQPKKEVISYGEVSLSYVGNDELYAYFDVREKDIEKIRERKEEIFRAEINGTALSQSVFVNLPQDISLSDDMREMIENILSTATATQQEIIRNAISLIGQVPYQWGGKASHAGYNDDWWLFNDSGQQRGLDCSGFVQWVYMTSGYTEDITRQMISTKSMFELADTTYEELEPGDIGLLNHGETTNHAGIYLGNGYFIHCSSSAKTVTISQFPFRYFKKIEKNSENRLQIEPDAQHLYYEQGKTFASEEEAEEIPDTTEQTDLTTESTPDINQDDVYLLAQLIVHEAGLQGYNGKVAVGEVVRNRMAAYGQGVREVVYAPNQFSHNDRIASITPDEESLSIARRVLEGRLSILNNADVLFFRNPMVTSGIEASDPVNWGAHTWFTSINDHAFYTTN